MAAASRQKTTRRNMGSTVPHCPQGRPKDAVHEVEAVTVDDGATPAIHRLRLNPSPNSQAANRQPSTEAATDCRHTHMAHVDRAEALSQLTGLSHSLPSCSRALTCVLTLVLAISVHCSSIGPQISTGKLFHGITSQCGHPDPGWRLLRAVRWGGGGLPRGPRRDNTRSL